MADSPIPQRGVYAITCSDGRSYVGSTTRMAGRWREHRRFLRLGTHCNRALQDRWIELGESAFTFSVLQEVSGGNLIEAEQHHIDRLAACSGVFNHAPLAGTQKGIVHTAETRAKVRAANVSRYADPAERAKLSVAQTERFKDPAERAKISAWSLARWKDPAHRAKQAASRKGKLAGEKNAAAKITANDVREMRQLAAAGLSQSRIGERFGIRQGSVSKIVRHLSWTHIA